MRKYSDDYEMVITTDENGNEKKSAVYRGEYFEIELDEKGLIGFKRICIVLLAVITVLHVSGGFVNNPGMYQFYIALPYVAAFFPLLYLAISVFRLPKEKRKFRRDEIGLSFGRMKSTSFILLAILCIGLLGELVFLIFGSTKANVGLETLFLTFEIPTFLAVYFFIRVQKQVRVHASQSEGKILLG